MQQDSAADAKILVIDDSAIMRSSINEMLQEDFTVVEAEDGESGWAILLTDPHIAALITDATMKKIAGDELINRVRSHPDQQINNLPIILLTSSSDEAVREKALEMGVTDFIVKPLEKTQLLARLKAHVEFFQKRNQLNQCTNDVMQHFVLDPITQLTSEQYLLLKGDQDIAFAKRHENNFSVIAVGIDCFGEYQKDYGKHIGNEILKYIANIIKTAIRSEDSLAMILPANFAILATSTGRLEATVLCERIRKQIAIQEFATSNITIPISITLGLVSLKTDRFDDIESFLHMALQRVTKGQKSGGNRLVAHVSQDIPSAENKPLIIDINEALAILEQGDSEIVLQSLPALLQKILPLIALADSEYQWGMDNVIHAIMSKLSEKTA